MNWIQVLTGGGVGAVLVALITAITGRGKNRADAAKTLAEASATTVASLGAQLKETETRLNARIDGLQGEVNTLKLLLQTEERRVRAAARYIGQLLGLLRTHAPDASLPDLPEDLEPLREWIGTA